MPCNYVDDQEAFLRTVERSRAAAAWGAAFEHALALQCELGRTGDASGRPWARLTYCEPTPAEVKMARAWADTVAAAAVAEPANDAARMWAGVYVPPAATTSAATSDAPAALTAPRSDA